MPYDNDGNFVSMNDTYDVWEPFAIELLVSTAKTYNGFVTYKQLGEFVQDQTSVRHNGLLTNWIGGLLQRVILHCDDKKIPHLSALCVKEDGTVGDGYRGVPFQTNELESMSLDQLDDHAAKTRLACYRHFGADLPPDGGEPTLTPRARESRRYKRQMAKLDEPPKLCPVHFIALPATGRCDMCD